MFSELLGSLDSIRRQHKIGFLAWIGMVHDITKAIRDGATDADLEKLRAEKYGTISAFNWQQLLALLLPILLQLLPFFLGG